MRARRARNGANVAPVDRHAAVQERRPRRRRRRPGGGRAAPKPRRRGPDGRRPAPRLAMQRPTAALNRAGSGRTPPNRSIRFGWAPPPRGTPAGGGAPTRHVGGTPRGTAALRVEDERPERERVRRRLGLREGERPQASVAGYPGRPPAGPGVDSVPAPPSLAPIAARPAGAYSSFGGSARATPRRGRVVRAGHLARRGDGRARQRRDALDVSLETSAERPSKLRRPLGGGFDPSPSRRRAEYPRLEEKPRDESSSAHAAATRKTHRACVSSAGAPPPAAATAPHAARISAATAHEASEGASRSSRPSGMSRRPSFTFPTEFRSFPPPPAPPPAPTPASSIV